jgi:putative sterol carrier protein
MTNLEQLTERVRKAVGDDSGLDAKIKFKFGDDGFLFIDGKSAPNQVRNADDASDITISVSMANFERIIDGQLNPKIALMTGRMRLRGDIRIAMRLDKVFGLAPTQM